MTPVRAPLAYRLLTRLLPRDVRARFGDEIHETAHAAAGQAGHWRGFADAVRTVVGLRRDMRRERRAARGRGHLLADLRFSLRSLRRSPAFFGIAILTLALGIGAFTVVYAIVDAMLLRPLPFGDRSDRLVTIHSTHPSQARDWDDSELSYADLLDLRDRSSAFASIEGVLDRNFSVATFDDNARVLGASVTPGLFTMLGVAPVEGRLFRDDEAALPGLEPVVIISHSLWQRLLAGDRSAIGKPLLLNARPVTLIGVMPEGFLFPEQHQLWLPYAADRTLGRGNRSLIGVGLLKPGISVGQAAADVDRVAAALAREYPESNREWGVHVLSLRDFHIGDARGLQAMLAAVVLLLLVACANVAGLLVSRGMSRTQELVTRAALGASRGRLAALLLADAVAIAVAGGLLGVGLSFWGLRALRLIVAELPAYWAQPTVDLRVLLSALLATTIVAIVSGMVPAWRLSRVEASAASTAQRAVGGTPSTRRVQRALVIAQVAACFVLLAGATLLAGSAVALQRADPGFDPSPILSGRFYIAGDAYDPIADRAAVVNRVAAAVEAIPGVVSVAVTQAIPADDGGGTILVRAPRAAGGDAMGVTTIATTEGLWDTLGLQLLSGRTFTAAEHGDPEAGVVIVNQRLADAFWGGQNALNQTLDVVNAGGAVTTRVRVVGVAPNLIYEEFGESTPQAELNVYMPYGRSGGRTLAILARTAGSPSQYSEAMRQAVRSVDGSFAAFDILSLEERRRLTTWGERFLATTFTGFAVGALLLACLGTYGVVAYAAAQRRREIGVRVAIGATRTDILGLFVRGGMILGLLGIAAGVPLALLTARGLSQSGMLFEVSPWNVWTWSVLPMALLVSVLVATLEPALRASRVDPTEALRD